MTDHALSLIRFYKGWEVYQQHLIAALTPLSSEQLNLRVAPHLRSIGEIASHIIGARARWFHDLMGQGSEEVAPMTAWDHHHPESHDAGDLVNGLNVTWQVMQDALARWTSTDLDDVFEGTYQGEHYRLTRQWVIWHVIEHDLHHGGELSFSLGIHGLAAPDL